MNTEAMAQSSALDGSPSMPGDMSAARAKKPCPVCGKEMGANNMARHLAKHKRERRGEPMPSRQPTRGRRKESPSAAATSKGIGRYLDALAAGVGDAVALGQLKGFPNRTTDPEVVERAIATIRANAGAGSAVARLKRQQRIITLERELAALRERASANGSNPRDFFISNAREWAIENGIGYGAFRAMGVPAATLKAAGIDRTLEP